MMLTPTQRSQQRIKSLLLSASSIVVCLSSNNATDTWALLAQLDIQRSPEGIALRLTCQDTVNSISMANTPSLCDDVIGWIESCANTETYQEVAA